VNGWTIVVPLKALPNAKSRLATTLSAAEHRELVEAIRADTLRAARAVARVLVVSDAPMPGSDLVQSTPGLNGAVREAAARAAAQWPGAGVAALVGDLPALRPDELAAALHDAPALAFVPDAAGTGTTLLVARDAAAIDPRFGPGSATRHGADHARLAGGPGLRCDVDTVEDLDDARELGVGPATERLLARWKRNIACSSGGGMMGK
jgi:2-phospho-L-lactate guanylyltransferase